MKLQKSILALVTMILMGFSINSSAAGGNMTGFTIAPALYYESSSRDNGTTKTSSSVTLIDMRLAYIMGNFYFGALYNTYSSGSSPALKHTHMGPSIGYVMGGFNAVFSYLLDVQQDVSATSKYKGTGMQLDVGYAFNLGSWAMGPQFSYTSFAYSKLDTSGVETDVNPELKITQILPKFAFWFWF